MMFDPMGNWLKLLDAGAQMARTSAALAETMTASHAVIARRSAIIGAAINAPASADRAELSRMVPEKVNAFGASGASIGRDIIAMQSALMQEAVQLGMMAMTGRLPGAGALAERSANLAVKTMTLGAGMGARSLAPVHRAATANARRLRRAKQRSRVGS